MATNRLGRSVPGSVHIVTELKQRAIGFERLTEKTETDSAAGRLFCVFTALSEFERSLIRERTYAGLAAAHARGRKPKLDEQQVQETEALLRNPDIQVEDVARRYGVSHTTLYKYIGVITPRQ